MILKIIFTLGCYREITWQDYSVKYNFIMKGCLMQRKYVVFRWIYFYVIILWNSGAF